MQSWVLAEWDAFPNELRFSAFRFTVTRLRDFFLNPVDERKRIIRVGTRGMMTEDLHGPVAAELGAERAAKQALPHVVPKDRSIAD